MLFRGMAGGFTYDAERIAKILPDLPENTRYVLLGHGHYDHLMDIGYYLTRESGATINYVGSKTAENILLGFKKDGLRFQVPQDGKPIEGGRFRITAFSSDHAPHIFGFKFMAGKQDAALESPPTYAGQYVEGDTYIYFIDFLDENNTIVSRIFVNSAANSPEGLTVLEKHREFLAQHPTNVAILCVPGWDKVRDYPDKLLRLVNPESVVLSHYDHFAAPYKNGEDPKKDMRVLPFSDYDGFLKTLRDLKIQNNYRFTIHEPKTGQCLRFPQAAPTLDCEK
jgi:hypothetical protein